MSNLRKSDAGATGSSDRRVMFMGRVTGDMMLGVMAGEVKRFGESHFAILLRWEHGTRRQRIWARTIRKKYPKLVARWEAA